MKTLIPLWTVALATMAFGCAHTVAPIPTTIKTAQFPATPDKPLVGSLEVFSAYDPMPPVSIDPERQVPYHSDFTIDDGTGARPRRIKNQRGLWGENPVVMQLPAGKYTIVTKAKGFGLVSVPVEIVPGARTIVHLADNGVPAGARLAAKADSVCLPDGRQVGWRIVLN